MDNADDDCMTCDDPEVIKRIPGWKYAVDGTSSYAKSDISGVNEKESMGVAMKVGKWVARQYWKICDYASRFWYEGGL